MTSPISLEFMRMFKIVSPAEKDRNRRLMKLTQEIRKRLSLRSCRPRTVHTEARTAHIPAPQR